MFKAKIKGQNCREESHDAEKSVKGDAIFYLDLGQFYSFHLPN